MSDLKYEDPIEKYINEPGKHVRKVGDLEIRASLSGQYFGTACNTLSKIISEEIDIGVIGYSSGGMRTHYIVRDKNNDLVEVHISCWGEDAFYFKRSELIMYFQEENLKVPNWNHSNEVEEFDRQQQ